MTGSYMDDSEVIIYLMEIFSLDRFTKPLYYMSLHISLWLGRERDSFDKIFHDSEINSISVPKNKKNDYQFIFLEQVGYIYLWNAIMTSLKAFMCFYF